MKNRTSINLRSGLFVLAGLMISGCIFGQVNFSGNWAFNRTKSNIGEGGTRMISRKIIISQSDNTFTLERYFTSQQGEERKITETYTLDGNGSTNTYFDTERKSIATWSADKKSLIVTSKMVFEMNGQQNEINSVEVYTLSDGNALLTIDSKSKSSMGERKYTAVYDKK